jgi:two-component system response regulator RegA
MNSPCPTRIRPSLLVVDDDPVFARTLADALERRGYSVRVANDYESALAAATPSPPQYAVLDLRLPDGSGLSLVKHLRSLAPDIRMVMLTGYGSIATTVDAIKLGACYYLTKPANADEVLAALHRDEPDFADTEPPPADAVPSVYRVEWEHIHRVLAQQNGNISESARVLGIHRRTLQRKLGKHPVRR